MARWIKEEFEAVVAVICVGIASILPWSVSIASASGLGTIYSLRWWIGEVRYFTAISNFNGWAWAWDSIMRQSSVGVFPGYVIWGVGSALFGVVLLITLILVMNETTITARYPVRIVAGAPLMMTGVCYIAATAYISLYGVPGMYVPLGGLFNMLFGGFLLTNQYRSEGVVGVDSTQNSTEQ